MALPLSFSGYQTLDQIQKARRLMIGCDGPPDSGKTEFAMSAPDPGIFVCMDRGIDGVMNNPNPPPTRNTRWGFDIEQAPKATQMTQAEYLIYWKGFYGRFIKALENKDARTLVLDGDSDSWEVQRLAEFGRLSKVPSNLYDNVNAARRAMYARAYDSGKIIIATNKIRKVYVTKMRPDGKPEVNSSGNEVRVWNGDYERQGFSDQEYLWAIQLRHIYDPAKERWGVRIMKCKAQPSLVGYELWGELCNFRSLVETVYPHIDPKEWGYAA